MLQVSLRKQCKEEALFRPDFHFSLRAVTLFLVSQVSTSRLEALGAALHFAGAFHYAFYMYIRSYQLLPSQGWIWEMFFFPPVL